MNLTVSESKAREFIDCPMYIEALLSSLGGQIELVEWNKTQKSYDAPTRNVGGYWANDVFEMRSFVWCTHDGPDDSCKCNLPNFKCGDIEVTWYKYLGRGTRINGEYSADEIVDMYNRCYESIV